MAHDVGIAAVVDWALSLLNGSYFDVESKAKLRALCAAAEKVSEFENALISALGGNPRDDIWHRYLGKCPYEVEGTEWDRDPDCAACQRLERLIGHRRPKEGA